MTGTVEDLAEGWTEQLVTGLAQYLAAGGVGVWRPPPAAVYQAGEIGLLYRAVPPTPDCIVTLAEYVVASDYVGVADVTVGVQVRVRGTTVPTICDRIADAVYALLHGAAGLTVAGVRVVQIRRQSYAPMGQDGNKRWERSENYYVDAMRPNTNNPD